MTSGRPTFDAYLCHLRWNSARFVDVLSAADPAARVPSCPDWAAEDLLHHLTVVQTFWADVVLGRVSSDEQVQEFLEPPRQASYPQALQAMRAATSGLVSALEATAPHATRWTWAPDQTAGFIYRRQAHEALIHRLDAELTAGPRTPFDPHLAADGVDEVLRLMFGAALPWATVTPDQHRRVRIEAVDAGARWVVTPARLTGTHPDGTWHDEPHIYVSDDSEQPVTASIRASAEDLDCWLWRRPALAPVRLDGDQDLLETIQEVLNQPVN